MSHHNNSVLNLIRQHGLDWATFNFNYHHPCESTEAASRMVSGAILACYEDATSLLDKVYGLSGVEMVTHQLKLPERGG
jgi:hypothetical protein